METQNDIVEATPVESPSTEIAQITSVGDADALLIQAERIAVLAPRIKKARDMVLASQTYAEDWVEFNGYMCLKSAGAERVGTLFDIKFFETADKKEEFTDSLGKGYRYVCNTKATMGNRVVAAKGIYSTRDKLLGRAKGEYKALEDIPENSIQMAAFHIACGNAIKALLGLRGIPVAEWNKIMGKLGKDSKAAGSATFTNGSKGGTAKGDSEHQKELAEKLIEMANGNTIIVYNDETKDVENEENEFSASDPIAAAKLSCIAVSSFYSKKDDKTVQGKESAKLLKGKWLNSSLAKVRKQYDLFKNGE